VQKDKLQKKTMTQTEHAVSALLELIAHYHELLTNRASLERRLSIAEAQMKVRREQVKTLEKQTGIGKI